MAGLVGDEQEGIHAYDRCNGMFTIIGELRGRGPGYTRGPVHPGCLAGCDSQLPQAPEAAGAGAGEGAQGAGGDRGPRAG